MSWLEKNLADSLSREQRRMLVEWEHPEISVSAQATLLSLNRSSLYYQPTPVSSEEIAIKHRSDEIYTKYP